MRNVLVKIINALRIMEDGMIAILRYFDTTDQLVIFHSFLYFIFNTLATESVSNIIINIQNLILQKEGYWGSKEEM